MNYGVRQISCRKMLPSDWSSLKGDILELENELFGGTELCEDEESYERLFTNPETISYVAEIGDAFAGFTAGEPGVSFEDYVDEGGGVLYHVDKIGVNSVYVVTIEVKPHLQDRGIGTRLFGHLIDEAKKQGYESVAGHFRPNASAHMMKKYNPQLVLPCPNYFDTGEEYIFCKLMLK